MASIGRVQASWRCCLIASLLMGVIIWLYTDPLKYAGASALFSAFVVNRFGLSRKPRQPHKSKRKRFSVLFVCGTVYLLLWGSSLYFSATLRNQDREKMPLRAAMNHFLMSPEWRDILQYSWRYILDISRRYIPDISWRYIPDISWRYIPDISWRYILDISWRYILDISWQYFFEQTPEEPDWKEETSAYKVTQQNLFRVSTSFFVSRVSLCNDG